MTVLDKDPIRIDAAETMVLAVYNIHIIKVDFTPCQDAYQMPRPAEGIPAIREAFGQMVAEWEAVWSRDFFEDWILNFRPPGRSSGVYIQNAGTSKILG